jgi:hypothetical protein
MNETTGIVRKLTATDLAAHLEGFIPSQRCDSTSPLRRAAPRLAFCASLLAGVIAHEQSAHAVIVIGADPACGCGTPTSAYQTGYATGYNYGYANGYNSQTNPAPFSTGSKDAAQQPSYNEGFNNGMTAGVAAQALGLPPGSLFDNTPPSDLAEDDFSCATCGSCASTVSCGAPTISCAACGAAAAGGGCGGCG